MDPRRVADIVRAQFPEVGAATVEYLGEGCDSQAFEVDGRWVFRFPKRDDVEPQLLREGRVLPVLAKQSPVALPVFSFHGAPSPAFPRHFAGYPKLPGVPALGIEHGRHLLETWAPLVGRFLSWLHSFPADEAARLGVERANPEQLIEEMRSDALDNLEYVRRLSPDSRVDAWQRYLSAPPLTTVDPHAAVLVHADLAAEHVLCDAATMAITGIIDWSDMAIDDRSMDFATLFHWGGEALVDAVLQEYVRPLDDGTRVRARYLGACRGAADVAFGSEMGKQEYIDAGLRALAHCIR